MIRFPERSRTVGMDSTFRIPSLSPPPGSGLPAVPEHAGPLLLTPYGQPYCQVEILPRGRAPSVLGPGPGDP